MAEAVGLGLWLEAGAGASLRDENGLGLKGLRGPPTVDYLMTHMVQEFLAGNNDIAQKVG